MVRLHLSGDVETYNYQGMLFKTPHNESLSNGLDGLSTHGWHVAAVRFRRADGKWQCQCQCGYEFAFHPWQVRDAVERLPAVLGDVLGSPCCSDALPFVSFVYAADHIPNDHGHHIAHTYWVPGCCKNTRHHVEDHYYTDDE